MKKYFLLIALLLSLSCWAGTYSKALRDAAVFGDFKTVKQLITQQPDIVHGTDKYGFTVLHEVVGEHRKRMVSILVIAGAKVNAQNEDGNAPLHMAAYDYMVEALLSYGATLELENNNGDTPLHTAASEPDSNQIIQALLTAGANPMHKNHSGITPIEIALSRKEAAKVELLKRYIK